jgi:hypothetical protein
VNSPQSIALPEIRDVGEGARALVYLSTIVGALLAAWARWRQGRKKRERKDSLLGKGLRYDLDATRQLLHVVQLLLRGGGYRITQEERDEIARQLVLISDVREELWIADGNASRHDRERLEKEVIAVLTRTQKIKALPPPTPPEDTDR